MVAALVAAEAWVAGDLTGGGGTGGGPFTFGGETNRKYNLTFSVSARNLLNNVNYAAPVGQSSVTAVWDLECAGGSAVLVRLSGAAH